jgi:5-methylcytosine-specific restriction enzyme subunit McrC
MPLTSIPILEQGHATLPLDALLHDNEIDVFPEVATGKYVSIRFSRGKIDLRANKFIGYIPLNSRYVLHVKPKFSLNNLLSLLAGGSGDSHALEFFTRSYHTTHDPNRALLDFLAGCLSQELNALAKEGLWRTYIRTPSVSAFPAGRVQPAATVQRAWSCGRLELVHCERFEIGKDTECNRLIKYATWLLSRPVADYAGVDIRTVSSLKEHLHRFDGVKLDHSLSFLPRAEYLTQLDAFPKTHPSYGRICRIALYVLRSLGLDMLNQGTEATLPSFVVDLESVFERYVFRTLQRELPTYLPDAQVLDGNSEGARELFSDRRGYLMTPDIVVTRRGEPILVADVKYKDVPERDDRSQVITYAVGYGTTQGLLICPASSRERHGLRRLGTIKNNVRVDEYYFDLSSDNLVEEDGSMAQVVALLA